MEFERLAICGGNLENNFGACMKTDWRRICILAKRMGARLARNLVICGEVLWVVGGCSRSISPLIILNNKLNQAYFA